MTKVSKKVSIKEGDVTDPRVARTRAALRQSLLKLSQAKGFDKVTVNDIARHAGVNRATFYNHYVDKWALLDSWIGEMRDLMDKTAFTLSDPRALVADSTFVPDLVVGIFNHVAEHEAFYQLMVGRNRIESIAISMRVQIEKFIEAQIGAFLAHDVALPMPASLLGRSYAAGFVGVIEWWLEHKLTPAPRQMAQWVWRDAYLIEQAFVSEAAGGHHAPPSP